MQETFIRAWRSFDRFEGRSALRSWLYRIATQRLLRHARQPQAAGAADGSRACRRRRSSRTCATARRALDRADARQPRRRRRRSGRASTVARESVRLAFVAALQHLPPRQRAVLILREVLALEGERGRRAPRHERRVREQRAPARPRDARASDATPSTTAPSVDAPTRSSCALRRGVRALRHGRAHVADPRGRHAVDAAVRPLAHRPRRHLHVVVRARQRLPRLACHPRGVGERRAGVRPVQAARRRRGLRAVGATGARDRERHASSSSPSSSTPPRCSRASGFRSSSPGSPPVRAGNTCVRPMSSTSSRSGSDAFCSRTAQPRFVAASWRRASASTVTASASTPATSQSTTTAVLVGEHSTDPVAQSRKVGATDRAADGEGDLVRPGCRHRKLDAPPRQSHRPGGHVRRRGRRKRGRTRGQVRTGQSTDEFDLTGLRRNERDVGGWAMTT